MRAGLRLLAAVQKGSTYLEAGAPTGLTGVLTAPAPRTTLIHLYSTTLAQLQKLPEASVYRQSVEALTRHRLSIVEAAKPAGLAEWQQRVQATVDAHPDVYLRVPSLASAQIKASQPESNIVWRSRARDETRFGKPADRVEKARNQHGPFSEAEAAEISARMAKEPSPQDVVEPIEPEPALTAEQIGEIEDKIGAGLIEEVIDVAEGELQLAVTMAENRVWEDLEEKPAEGQWTYFARDAHAAGTQAP